MVPIFIERHGVAAIPDSFIWQADSPTPPFGLVRRARLGIFVFGYHTYPKAVYAHFTAN